MMKKFRLEFLRKLPKQFLRLSNKCNVHKKYLQQVLQ